LRILGDAVEAVQRNLYALALYLAVTVGFSIAGQVANYLAGGPPESPYASGLWTAYLFGLDAVFLIAIGVAQAVVFSRLGKDIDRPLWKIGGDGEAAKRYFVLWLALNAVATALDRVALWSHTVLGNDALTATLALFHAVVIVIHIPIGAAIMFLGPFEWRKLPECLRPLWRQFPQTLVVVLFNGVWFALFIFLLAQTESQPWLRPALQVVFAYVDFVVFAAAWFICMLDRQEPGGIDLGF